MGHVIYFLAYKGQPVLFRGGGNPGNKKFTTNYTRCDSYSYFPLLFSSIPVYPPLDLFSKPILCNSRYVIDKNRTIKTKTYKKYNTVGTVPITQNRRKMQNRDPNTYTQGRIQDFNLGGRT